MTKINEYQPKRDLELFCYALVSEQCKGNKDAAERLSGTDKGKFYWAWKKHPEFRAWYVDLCFQILRYNSAIPPYALLSAIIDKDVQAIRTYYELTGQLKNIIKGEGFGNTTVNIYPHKTLVFRDIKEQDVPSDGNTRNLYVPEGTRNNSAESKI